jgi:hypothetical protein
MDERILINPDNRVLAGNGANDFSLYGAPADPALTFRPAEPDGEAFESAAPSAGGAPNGGSDPPTNDIQQSALTASDAAGPAWGSAAIAAARTPEPAAAQAQPAAETAAAPSALAPAAFAPITPVAPASPAAAEAAPVAAAAPAPADLGPAPATFSAPVAPVQAPSPVQAPAEAIAAEPLAAAVSGPLASLSIDEAVGRAEDNVQDLLGTDPAAGIATLVSLVSLSDVVDLGDAGAAAADVSVAPVDTMLDALAADASGEAAPELDDAADAADALPGTSLIGGGTPPADADDLPFGLG